MRLRKGKIKSLLESSINAALLAVEVYNKPRTTFRSEAYITLIIIAWTKLFHAYFHSTIGDKYYYKKKKSNRGTVHLMNLRLYCTLTVVFRKFTVYGHL